MRSGSFHNPDYLVLQKNSLQGSHLQCNGLAVFIYIATAVEVLLFNRLLVMKSGQN